MLYTGSNFLWNQNSGSLRNINPHGSYYKPNFKHNTRADSQLIHLSSRSMIVSRLICGHFLKKKIPVRPQNQKKFGEVS